MRARIRDVQASGVAKLVDVDGSYLFRKHQRLAHDGTQIPPLDVPLVGWEPVNAGNYMDMAKKIPRVTHGKYRVLELRIRFTISLWYGIQVCCTRT